MERPAIVPAAPTINPLKHETPGGFRGEVRAPSRSVPRDVLALSSITTMISVATRLNAATPISSTSTIAYTRFKHRESRRCRPVCIQPSCAPPIRRRESRAQCRRDLIGKNLASSDGCRFHRTLSVPGRRNFCARASDRRTTICESRKFIPESKIAPTTKVPLRVEKLGFLVR